jgi:predicted glycoside hydrolase/deacetylase ChbG (UPF0249 family)
MSRKLLIVNADGYGMTDGVNRGIEETIEAGIVRSISVNSNFDSVAALGPLVRRTPWLSVGVHLNPIVGRPIAGAANVPTLVDRSGHFHHESFVPRLLRGAIAEAELEFELGLQIERVRGMGLVVSHLDSHQNAHLWPPFFRLFLRLARRYEIPWMRTDARWICVEHPHRLARSVLEYATHPRRLVTQAYARYLMRRARRTGLRLPDRTLRIGACGPPRPLLEAWLQVARMCPPGMNEMHCHPGYVDDELRRWAKVIVEAREEELAALTDRRLREAFERHGVESVSFHEL